LAGDRVDYSIEVSDRQTFLRVTTTGSISIELVRQWSVDVEARSRATGVRRYLFDVRSAKNACSAIESYMFAYKEAAALNLSRVVRSAILVGADDKSHDFVETTMRNAGFNVRLFSDEATAIAWLEDGDR
jgi:hypothetical protein